MKKLLIIAMLAAFAISSCKKSTTEPVAPVAAKSSNDIKVPAGFKWENSRNVNFSVGITDTRFQNMIYMIAIYDGDPAAGGNLISKGSATNIRAFITKLYLSNQILQVYIVKTSPDNSKVIVKIAVNATVVSTTMGS